MVLTTSGAISLDDIHVEVGGTTGTQVSFNDADIREAAHHQNCDANDHQCVLLLFLVISAFLEMFRCVHWNVL